MIPFEINIQSVNLEVVAKITDSMVQDYGCRVKYDKDTDLVIGFSKSNYKHTKIFDGQKRPFSSQKAC